MPGTPANPFAANVARSENARAPRTEDSPISFMAPADAALPRRTLRSSSLSSPPEPVCFSTSRDACTSCSRPVMMSSSESVADFGDETPAPRGIVLLPDLPSFCESLRFFVATSMPAGLIEVWLAKRRRRVELNRFLTWLSVLPGMDREMTAHLFPWMACATRIARSSSSVNGPRLTMGLSWLHHLRRQLLLERPGRASAIAVQLPGPPSFWICSRRSASSSGVHEFFTILSSSSVTLLIVA
mmetsp:Transcript_8854/g.40243  ORF Transcript_8854/g.40243 Transcript_8854/m.40243 type:complete len:242 (-) Transcript_8854:33-758(-)